MGVDVDIIGYLREDFDSSVPLSSKGRRKLSEERPACR